MLQTLKFNSYTFWMATQGGGFINLTYVKNFIIGLNKEETGFRYQIMACLVDTPAPVLVEGEFEEHVHAEERLNELMAQFTTEKVLHG